MQNTTTSKEIPDRLIENFMICGVSQEKLMKEFTDDKDAYQKILFTKLNPDILFSMYNDSVDMEKYTQFIFPNKIQIEFDEGKAEARFHSFLTTDVKGNQSFFHCFFFYEDISQYQIMHDFNFEGQMMRLRQKKLQQLKKRNQRRPTYNVDASMMQNLQNQKNQQRQQNNQNNQKVIKKRHRDANAGIDYKRQQQKKFNQGKNEDATADLHQKLKTNANTNQLLEEHNNDAVMVKLNEDNRELENFMKQKKMEHERDKSVFMINTKAMPETNHEPNFGQGTQEQDQSDKPDKIFEFDSTSNTDSQKDLTPKKSGAGQGGAMSQMVTSPTAMNMPNRGDLGHSNLSAWKQNQIDKIQKRKITLMGNSQKQMQASDPRKSQMGGNLDRKSAMGGPYDRKSAMGGASGIFGRASAMGGGQNYQQQRYRNNDDNRATVNWMVETLDKGPNDYSRKKSSMYSNSIVMSQVGLNPYRNQDSQFLNFIQSNVSEMQFPPASPMNNNADNQQLMMQPSTAHFNNEFLQRSQNNQIEVQPQNVLQGQQQQYRGFQGPDMNSNGGFDEDQNRYASYMSQNIRQSSFKQSQMMINNWQQEGRSIMTNNFLNQTQISNDAVDQQWQDLCRKVQEVVYVPVAFVIQTKAEFHDHFKLILKKIYESFRQSKQYSLVIQNMFEDMKRSHSNNSNMSSFLQAIPSLQMCMAYADLITHIAFLRTIPAPVFNSEVNILFMGQTFNFKENMFNQLPHKNQECIDKLIDCLDFNTILMCIKALLFDRTLIVFSQEQSLLFNVVEGLKQLMFPFTVDNQQFLPANNNYPNSGGLTLKDIFDEMDGIQSVIFAIQTSNECNYEIYKNYENSVVLDIDASIAFESQDEASMPKFPNELQILRILNGLRNRMRYNYDKVYPDIQDDRNVSIMEIRQVFFSMFKKFLIAAFNSIKSEEEDPSNLNDYWDQDYFFQELEDLDDWYAETGMDPNSNETKTYQLFGRQLVQSQSFVHFMDGYLDEQTVNFDVVNSILLNQRELGQRYKKKQCSMSRFNKDICKTIQSMSQIEYQKLKALNKQFSDPVTEKKKYFQDSCVLFNHALPSLKQRTMLFEKIYFLNEMNRKRESRKRSSPDSFINDWQVEDANKKFQKNIIDIVRRIFQQQHSEEINFAEKQIQNIQKQQEEIQQQQQQPPYLQQEQTPQMNKEGEDLTDIAKKYDTNNLDEPEQEIVDNVDDLGSYQPGLNSFASLVRNNDLKRKNDSFAQGGDGLISSRQHSILEQVKNGAPYRQSDFQSARFADPFSQAQSRESTQVKQTIDFQGGTQQTRLSQIDESEIDPSQVSNRETVVDKQIDSDQRKQESDQQTPNSKQENRQSDNVLNFEQTNSNQSNQLIKSHFSSFAYHGTAGKQSYQQYAQYASVTEVSEFDQELIDKLNKVKEEDEARQEQEETTALELGDSQIIENSQEQNTQESTNHFLTLPAASSSNQLLSLPGADSSNNLGLPRDGSSPSKQRESSNQMDKMDNLLNQNRDVGITFRNMDAPVMQAKQNLMNTQQKPVIPSIRLSNILDQRRDEGVTFHDPEAYQNNLRLNKKNEQSTRLSQQIEPSEPMQMRQLIKEEQSSYVVNNNEGSLSSRTKMQNNFLRETQMDNNGTIDKKLFMDNTELMSVITADKMQTKDGQKFQKAMQKLYNNQQLDNEEILIQQNLKEILEVIEYRKDSTFIYGQKGLINFLHILFPVNFSNSERQNLNFYFTIRESLIDYVARKQLLSSLKQIEKINQLNDLNDNKESQDMFSKILRDTKKDSSKSLQKSDKDDIQNSLDQSNVEAAEQHNVNVGNLEQPERLKTFMAKNNITQVYTNGFGNMQQNPYESKLQNTLYNMTNDSQDFVGDMMVVNSPEIPQLNQVQSYLTDQEIVNRLTTLQQDLNFRRDHLEKVKVIKDKSKMMQLLGQLEELQAKQREDNNWFWIEKQEQGNAQLNETNDFDQNHLVSYQEVLTIIKYFNNFENKNCANGMILQLLMNFPVMEMSHHNRVQWILDQEGSKQSIDEVDKVDKEDFFLTGGRQDKYAGFICQKIHIIEYIFPISHFQCILDNMTRQEIMDFYARLRLGKKNNYRQHFDFDTKQFFNQHINQFDRNYPWDLPTDSQMNNQLFKDQMDYRQFQNLTYFLLYLKFIDVIQEHKQDLVNDDRGSLFLQERRKSKQNSVFDFEQLLYCISGDNQLPNSPLFEHTNKRDSLSMGNRYFETIDERVFYQCSISQYMANRKEQAQYNKYKKIEKIFEEQLKRSQKMQEEDQQSMLSQKQFFTGMFRSSNNSQSASQLGFDPPPQSADQGKAEQSLFQQLMVKFPMNSTQSVANINDTYRLDTSQNVDDVEVTRRRSSVEEKMTPRSLAKRNGTKSKQPSPRNNFFNFKIFGRSKRQEIEKKDDKKDRSKQAKSKDPGQNQVMSKFSQLESAKQTLNTARAGQNKSQIDVMENQTETQATEMKIGDMKKASQPELEMPQQPQDVRGSSKKLNLHKKNLSLQIPQPGVVFGNQNSEKRQQELEMKSSICGNVLSAGLPPQYDNVLQMQQRNSNLNKEEKDQYLDENFRMMREQPRLRSKHTQVQNRTDEPIQLSKDFLSAIINFWLQDNNRKLLYKDQFQKYTTNEKDNSHRKTQLFKVWKIYHQFYDIVVDFGVREPKRQQQSYDISDQEYKELAKQCYYVNIYNAIILFKLAEIASFQPKKIFNLKNFSSWLALEQNSRIMIDQRMYSAYQIKYDIIKNCNGRDPDNFSVDTHYVHPLIDFAFFMPKNNSLKLSDLMGICNNVDNLKYSLKQVVPSYIKDKLNINYEFNLIRLPYSLRQILKTDLLKTPLEYYKEHLNNDESIQDIQSDNSQYFEKKSVKNLSVYELQKIKQAQILEILKHIIKHVFQVDKIGYHSEFDKANRDSIREHIRYIIVKITKALNQDKLDQKMMSSHQQQQDQSIGNKGIGKSIIQTNQSMSIYSGSQGQGSHSGDSGHSRVPMTDYFIEWITPKYQLKPEKLFDNQELENQYFLIFNKKIQRESKK